MEREKTLRQSIYGVVRTTYLIDENGIISKAFGKVNPAQNPEQMLEELNDIIS